MFDLEKYKDEIIESIESLKEVQEETNENLQNLIEGTEDTEKVEQNTENDLSDLEDEENFIELYTEKITEQQDKTEILIQQNELILEQLEQANKNNVESGWMISITIVIALGFHYFINQFSKW